MSAILLFFACVNNTVNTEKVSVSPPVLDFILPEDGAQFIEFNSIEFSATVQDDVDPLDILAISWSSSIDGEFDNTLADSQGSIDFTMDSLSVGEHQITLQVTNSSQSSVSSMHNILVISQAEAPSIELLLPIDDFAEEDILTFFKINASDPNFSYEDLTLSFSSNLDGEFCTPRLESSGEGFCDATLSLGEHRLNFAVSNPNELNQSVEIDFAVLPSSQIDNDLDGYTEDDGDCNDEDPLISPNGVEIINDLDDDCDGQIDDETDIFDDDLDGYSEDDGDCDDTNPEIHPENRELCDGIDQDCNGIIDDGTICFDDDGDGWSENDGDCDDQNVNIYPNNTEDVDGLDNNCDGHIDEGSEFFDNDGDCYCASTPCYGSFEPNCTSFLEGDCDDADLFISPDASEFCDGIDSNCNGQIDENAVDGTSYYSDLDSDGYGNPSALVVSCSGVSGYVTNANDCNDSEALAWTGNTETCDYVDNDCNGQTDEGTLTTYYQDDDEDGYGNPNSILEGCTQPIGYIDNSDDCDDTEALAWTGNTEICDYVDNDCNGQTDEGLLSLFYVDADGDGYGNPNISAAMCSLIAGYSINSNDCDDTEALAWTGNTETCDYVDNDCNGQTDEGVLTTYYQDDDHDGYGNPNSTLEDCTQPVDYVLNDNDCNDSEDLAWSGNTESCDYVDNNCNGQTDEGTLTTYYQDNDLDGYGNPNSTTQDCTQPIGYVANTYDCDDTENLAFTGASESCDYVDNDCNGSTDEGVQTTYYQDFDGDGYGDISVTSQDCSTPFGYATNSTDCYDFNVYVYPGQTGFFTTNRGDGSYDYDCDGLESQYSTQSGSCDWWTLCGLDNAGWNGTPPACGDTGDFMSDDGDCSYACWGACCDKGGNTATQSCR